MTKKKKIIIISSLIIICISVFFALNNKPQETYEFIKAEKKKITQTVSETGAIKSVNEIELSFLNSGKLSKIYTKIGDTVSSSKILAELDYSDLKIKRKEAKASLDIARANLSKLTNGATQYEISVAEANVNQAKISYESSQKELEKTRKTVEENISQAEENKEIEIENKLSSSIPTIEIALASSKTALDNINTILSDNSIKDVFSVKNQQYSSDTKNKHQRALNSLNLAYTTFNDTKLNPNEANIKNSFRTSLISISETFTALSDCYTALENTIASYNFTQTQLDSYKSNISAQLTKINSILSSTQNSQQSLNDTIIAKNNALTTAKNNGDQQITSSETRVKTSLESWKISQAELEKMKAPARKQDISLYEAQIRQSEAGLESIDNQINNMIIKAPMDGVITKIEYKEGEQVIANKAIITILTNNNLNVEVDISESDINKIKIDNPVEITLDSFGDETKFYGKVYNIEPAETIIQDVIYYKTKISFNSDQIIDDKIKPGMTANVTIKTQEIPETLVIPSRAIIEKTGEGKFVRILENKEIKEIPITTGLYGDDGEVEILSGLYKDQEIILSINTKK